MNESIYLRWDDQWTMAIHGTDLVHCAFFCAFMCIPRFRTPDSRDPSEDCHHPSPVDPMDKSLADRQDPKASTYHVLYCDMARKGAEIRG